MRNPDHSFTVSLGVQTPIKLGGNSAKEKWQAWSNRMFVISFVIAVSLDPLFFYIPIIDEDNKCLAVDKSLRSAAITLRTLTDVTFLVSIVCQIRDAIKQVKAQTPQVLANSDWISKAKAIAGKLSWRSMAIDFVAVLPIPQVLLLHFFFQMRGSGYLEKRKLLNVFVLGQYLPRIYRIHLSTEKLTRTGKWAKCAFNILLYVLASHVLGAFWYYFSIQRETSCWQRACLKQGSTSIECMTNFYCSDLNINHTSAQRNTTLLLLKEKCLIDVPVNATAPFDFGIFLDSLKSGNTVSDDFPEKFLYCFWWGLRNLSNFGTNLQTSNYAWENCFAILISVIGLLLFLYLLGNVQTLIQMETTKSEEIRQKIKMKEKDLETWMDKHGLPEDMKNQIKENIHKKLQENKDADLEDLFSILPWYTAKSLKRFLCMSTIRKVPMLKNMDEKVLKMICDYLKQVKYPENTVVVRRGDPLDRMLFITDGILWTYTDSKGRPRTSSSESRPKVLQKGEFYGEELLKWASPDKSLGDLPSATQNVKCHEKVEGFVLMAKDLRSVVSKCDVWWNLKGNNHFVRLS